MVIPFIPGTNALWDPWQGSHNGKGLTEDAFDNATKVILNQDFVSGLTSPRSSSTTSPTSPRRRKAAEDARLPATGRPAYAVVRVISSAGCGCVGSVRLSAVSKSSCCSGRGRSPLHTRAAVAVSGRCWRMTRTMP
jgi:hypothetical protein